MSETFKTKVLQNFLKTKSEEEQKLFPYTHFGQFFTSFVDDLAVHSKKEHGDTIHFMCIEAVFYALKQSGWVISFRKSTIMTNEFVFLGLLWNIDEQSAKIQNDRIDAILNHRIPRSTAELSSRLSTINYYSSFIPCPKRIAIPLYQVIKSGVFKWTKLESEAYGDLLFMIGLKIRNYIYDPTKPLILLCDSSAVEASIALAQWDDQKLNLRIIGAKSVLLTTALRRQSPLHKEAFGLQLALTQAHPYLLQSKSSNNFIFTDASVLSYITRNKAFNNFLQALSENLSYYKGLSVVHISGRANSYCDILSRALDNAILERSDTNLSKEAALIIPTIFQLEAGTVINSETLVQLLNSKPESEFIDVHESSYRYVQKIDFSLYDAAHQIFNSETEFILGALLHNSPETVFKLQTWQDLLKIKDKAGHFKTREKQIQFLTKCKAELETLPYNTAELQKIKTFINQQADKVKGNKIVTSSNFLKVKNQVCSCKECRHLNLDDQESSLKDPIAMVKSLLPYLKNLGGQLLQN